MSEGYERSAREQELLDKARAIHDAECNACQTDRFKYVMSCGRFQRILMRPAPAPTEAGEQP